MEERGKDFGEHLHRLREDRGWSLREAGKRLGLAFTRLGEYEHGVDAHTGKSIVPPYRLVGEIARVYGAPIEDLLRLAGYGAGVELDDAELELVRGYRRLGKKERPRLLARLRELEDGSAPSKAAGPGEETVPG